MIYLEAIEVTILFLLFVNTAASDLKSGIVSNKSILIALAIGIPTVIPYYALFATDCLVSYLINVGICICVSMILYGMGIWGAGDSKLFSTVIILFPARLYCLSNRSMASCFLMITFIFFAALVFVIVDTVVIGIKQKDLFKIQRKKIDWRGYVKGFLFFFLVIEIVNTLLYSLLPSSILSDDILMTALHFIVILVAMKIEKRANWKHIIIMGLIGLASAFYKFSTFSLSTINLRAYLVVLLLIVFRVIADKYNYKTIFIEDLRPGMILSMGSIISFAGSGVKGLPSFSTEDLKSRLTQDEVDSINRWSKTRKGVETIAIVRKIPFALFIGVGTILFAVLEVIMA